MYAAYEGLDDETKDRIEGLTAVHDFMKAFGAQVPEERMAEMRERYPLVEHPVVVTHEVTGQRLLYVNRVFTDSIVGMDADESAELLEHLCRAGRDRRVPGAVPLGADSVVVWDNRAVQHYASSDYWPQRRVMERARSSAAAPPPERGVPHGLDRPPPAESGEDRSEAVGGGVGAGLERLAPGDAVADQPAGSRAVTTSPTIITGTATWNALDRPRRTSR